MTEIKKIIDGLDNRQFEKKKKKKLRKFKIARIILKLKETIRYIFVFLCYSKIISIFV